VPASISIKQKILGDRLSVDISLLKVIETDRLIKKSVLPGSGSLVVIVIAT